MYYDINAGHHFFFFWTLKHYLRSLSVNTSIKKLNSPQKKLFQKY